MMILDTHLFQDKLYFTTEDVAGALGIKQASAHVLCSRYVKKGFFIRIKNDFYILEQAWVRYGERDLFRIANHLQTPSYVSLGSALAFYGVTTQVQRNWIESVGLKRTVRFEASGTAFHYFKLKAPQYFGFVKEGDVFIATKEKAFVDVCHLSVYGKYAMDWSACDLSRLDREAAARIGKAFPERTQRFIKDRE